MKKLLESWEPIEYPGFENRYEVSSEGRFRSLDKEFTRTTRLNKECLIRRKGKLLKTNSYESNPYETIVLKSLDQYGNGLQKTVYVHKCVAELFLPNPEGRKTVTHRNGNKRDNRVDNLKWK